MPHRRKSSSPSHTAATRRRRRDVGLYSPLASGDDLDPEVFPRVDNISSAFFYQFLPRPRVPTPVEYVYVPLPRRAAAGDGRSPSMEIQGAIAQWNTAWEADFLRHDLLVERVPTSLQWLRAYEGRNLCLVADDPGAGRGRARYNAYATLYHLLPRRTLERFGLPLLKKGLWPTSVVFGDVLGALPADADVRLARAFAAHVWPLLRTGGRMAGFSPSEPLRLLAHNLDFWLPYVDHVAQERMRAYDRCDFDDDEPEQPALLARARADTPPDFAVDRPLKGGPVWAGEEDAWEATREVVEAADREGRLRGLIDAIRSHRVEEDFSDRWTYAREDFERRLYRKRTKMRVSFVELTDTIPVHGPESEVHGRLLYEDFFAVLNPADRRVIVCIRNGITGVGDIARELGYANHSPVSKALARIRRRLRPLLDDE